MATHTAGSDAPMTFTPCTWSSFFCAFAFGDGLHEPVRHTAAPVDRLSMYQHIGLTPCGISAPRPTFVPAPGSAELEEAPNSTHLRPMQRTSVSGSVSSE